MIEQYLLSLLVFVFLVIIVGVLSEVIMTPRIGAKKTTLKIYSNYVYMLKNRKQATLNFQSFLAALFLTILSLRSVFNILKSTESDGSLSLVLIPVIFVLHFLVNDTQAFIDNIYVAFKKVLIAFFAYTSFYISFHQFGGLQTPLAQALNMAITFMVVSVLWSCLIEEKGIKNLQFQIFNAVARVGICSQILLMLVRGGNLPVFNSEFMTLAITFCFITIFYETSKNMSFRFKSEGRPYSENLILTTLIFLLGIKICLISP